VAAADSRGVDGPRDERRRFASRSLTLGDVELLPAELFDEDARVGDAGAIGLKDLRC